MDLIGRLRSWSVGKPHVIVVEGCGGTRHRLAAEGALHRRGWPLAAHPADADLLVFCGRPTTALAPSIARLRAGMADPAASVLIGSVANGEFDAFGDDADRALDDAAALLRELARHFPTAENRVSEGEGEGAERQEGEGGDGHGGSDGHHRHDHGEHGDGEGDDHDHDGHDDMAPGGLAMATRAEDRDGLKLDLLQVPFGIGSFGWPPLIRAVLSLQGDVVQEARIEALGAASNRQDCAGCSWWDRPWRTALEGEAVSVQEAERWRAASHLESLGRFLDVAGHRDAALASRRLRDRCLTAAGATGLRDEARRLARAIRRGGFLERATAGTGILTADHARRLGVAGPSLRAAGRAEDLRAQSDAYLDFAPVCADGGGDVRARWLQWLAEIDQALELAERLEGRFLPVLAPQEAPRGRLDRGSPPPSQGLVAAIAALVVGQELAAARLTIASFDPDGNDAGGAETCEPGHGG